MQKIKELFKGIQHKLLNANSDLELKGICSDSRTIKKDELFIAIRGHECNGHDYIKEALKKGAAAVCSEHVLPNSEKAGFIIVKNTASVLPTLASRFFGMPSNSLRIIGVTGTNGKTTISYLIHETLEKAGKSSSLLGTVQYRIGKKILKPYNTTPDSLLLHTLLRQTRDCGTDYVVMEVSSHALRQSRVAGINFKVAVLSNVTGDHLDYHRNMNDYVRSKRLLFESLQRDSMAVLNRDDKFYNEFKKFTGGKVITYGINKDSNFRARHIELDINGSRFFMDTPNGTIDIRTSLIGRHNVYNILAATAVSFAEGIEGKLVSKVIASFKPVPGRMESVEAGQRFKVFIDYAHTHDALQNILLCLRSICKGKLIVVFGCGGNRDKTKRAKMGRIASELTDYVILTNDNPRTEDPEAILNQIEKGFPRDFKAYKRIPNRFEAIKESLINREPSDIVVIAGKGHEECQIIGKDVIPFNDKEVVRQISDSSS